MLRAMKVSILTTAGLVLLSPSVYANNDLTQNELRVRRNPGRVNAFETT